MNLTVAEPIILNNLPVRLLIRLDSLQVVKSSNSIGDVSLQEGGFVNYSCGNFGIPESTITTQEKSMPYPRFQRSSHYFILQEQLISMRNRINLHTVRDDRLLGILKYVSKTEEHQVYGALIPKEMINEDILNSTAYKTYYAYASGPKEPKKARKFKKHTSPKLKTVPVSPKESIKKPAKKTVTAMKSSKSQVGVIIKDTPGVFVSKKKSSVKGKISKGDGTDLGLGVPDEQQRKKSGIDEGTGTKLGVLDVPIYESESETESWGESVEEDDDDEDVSDDDGDDDDDNEYKNDDDDKANSDRTESDKIKIPDLNQSRTKYDEEDKEHESERVHTPLKFIPTNYEDKVDDEENMDEEEDDEVIKELYKDVNVNLGNEDAEMTNANQGGADQQ
ncbi:hypothetical protein Tco_0134248, partial [Tanacetum coccineum]